MTNKEFTRIKRELKPFKRLFLTVACLGLLSSCGGSGSEGSADAATAQDATKQIAAVPAGWVGRVPSTYFVPVNSFKKTPIGMISTSHLDIYAKDGVSYQSVIDYARTKKWKILSYRALTNSYIIEIYGNGDFESIQKNQKDTLSSSLFDDAFFIYLSRPNVYYPIDPVFNSASDRWNYESIKAPEAWDILLKFRNGSEPPSVGVGVNDFGFRGVDDAQDLHLESVYGNVPWYIACDDNNNFLKLIDFPTYECSNHGLHVSGIVGAKSGNQIGIAGIGSGAFPVKIHGAGGIYSSGFLTNLIDHLMQIDVKVVNMSYGNSSLPSALFPEKLTLDRFNEISNSAKRSTDLYVINMKRLDSALNKAGRKMQDILFVQSSGNSGESSWNGVPLGSGLSGDAASMDASDSWAFENIYKKSIVVGAFSPDRKPAKFTQLPQTDIERDNFILAPGVAISSTVVGGVEKQSGTSQAAPHVTGVATLLFQANTSLSAKDVRNIILDTADTNLGTPFKDRKEGDGSDGYRYLNAEAAVKEALARRTETMIRFSDDFNGSTLDATKWIGVLPWNSTGKNSTMLMGSDGTNNYMRLMMTQTDTGGNVLSPSFPSADKIRVTYRHRMHAGNGYFFPAMMITNETAAPENDGLSPLQYLAFKFKSSAWSGDNVCAAHDTPRVEGWGNDNGCVPMSLATAKRSSSFFNKFITTIVTYDSITGAFEFDLEGDGVVDIRGVLEPGRLFKPSRIAFTHFGWFTGHEVDIDSVKVEAIH